MNTKEHLFGLIALVVLIIVAKFTFEDEMLFYRLLIGLGFGYALARASMGFAGSVNRLSRTGSSTLASALLVMFVVTALFTAFSIYGNESAFKLNIYPINLALFIGGFMFGFGMSFTSCCATGSLTDVPGGFSRAVVSIFFLSMGVFLGYRAQGSDFVQSSWMTTARGAEQKGGVFLPDLFTFDGFDGYLGAFILTALLSSLAIYLARQYEKAYYDKYPPSEETKVDTPTYTRYERLFVVPWKMRVSVVIIALLFTSLLWLYEKGWGASTAFGLWFAKVLMLFGATPEQLSTWSGRSETFFSQSLLDHGTSIQNFAIILGALFYLLIAGKFKEKFTVGLSIRMNDFFLYAFGGLIMGFGTRLSNGCNVGALYTPIAEFSLSGWLYLIVVVTGGLLGNWVLRTYINKSCAI